MTTTLLPPPVEIKSEVEIELIPSDGRIDGSGGGPHDPDDDSNRRPERGRDPVATPLSVYRTITSFILVSVVMLFATLTAVVKARWVGSDDWVSVPLPHVLYWNTVILLVSSVTMERARRALRDKSSKECARWLAVTLVLGLGFLCGQLVAWRELVSQGLYMASNPGSLFIYLISGTHGLHILGGLTVLAIVTIFMSRWTAPKRKMGLEVAALYWHFMDGLWIYLLALLLITIQR